MTSVCHISTLHTRNDIRIFQKELISLTANYNCSYIVADGKGDELVSGIQIVDIGLRQSSRIKRALQDSNKALKKALKLDAELYHLHDPELMDIALKLKKTGKRVIYDAHEDLPEQIKTKDYIPKPLRYILSRYYKIKEANFSRKVDAIVSATPIISNKFIGYGATSVDVCNYPLLDENRAKPTFENNSLVYIGGISESRGILKLLDVVQQLDCQLNLAGSFFDSTIEMKSKAHPAWEKVVFHGFVNPQEVKMILSKSSLGIVLLKGFKSYRDSLPIKMFEYMNARIPFVASNFSLWEKIANNSNCGVCCDPENTSAIANTIQKLLSNKSHLTLLGDNGRKAVETTYNWDLEKLKLLELYGNILTNS